MFFILLLFMVGSACMIAMPIAHSAAYHAYEKSKVAEDANDEKNTTGFLGTAAWFQAVCYFLGSCSAMSFVWCGIELADKLK